MQRHEIALHGKLAPVDLTLHKRSNLIFYNATIINYSSRKNCTKMANEIGLKIRNGEFDPTHNTVINRSRNVNDKARLFAEQFLHIDDNAITRSVTRQGDDKSYNIGILMSRFSGKLNLKFALWCMNENDKAATRINNYGFGDLIYAYFKRMKKLKCAKMEPCNDFVFHKPKLAAMHYNKNCCIVSVPLTMLRLLIVGQVSTKGVFWPINTHNMLV
ncbi:conserved hypothetical protein [Trichinella spiralis]|uniref:hypothetical protein n=1 Tax=Trichinella spiralis TaxID=6334 RepID=UPI0001EFCF6D|nr:conserved hypothetical protein [Trichinella spiralis]